MVETIWTYSIMHLTCHATSDEISTTISYFHIISLFGEFWDDSIIVEINFFCRFHFFSADVVKAGL